jgi:hypothetical protein
VVPGTGTIQQGTRNNMAHISGSEVISVQVSKRTLSDKKENVNVVKK